METRPRRGPPRVPLAGRGGPPLRRHRRRVARRSQMVRRGVPRLPARALSLHPRAGRRAPRRPPLVCPFANRLYVFGWVVLALAVVGLRRAWRPSHVIAVGIYFFLLAAYLFSRRRWGARGTTSRSCPSSRFLGGARRVRHRGAAQVVAPGAFAVAVVAARSALAAAVSVDVARGGGVGVVRNGAGGPRKALRRRCARARRMSAARAAAINKVRPSSRVATLESSYGFAAGGCTSAGMLCM